jgi:hypothetical protein
MGWYGLNRDRDLGTFRFLKMMGSSSVTAQLAAYQEGLGSASK